MTNKINDKTFLDDGNGSNLLHITQFNRDNSLDEIILDIEDVKKLYEDLHQYLLRRKQFKNNEK